ncbi:MAG: flippase-like domain-containing protein [Asgard group archaeon]|nr:flippase-like domain-containing protein [Asgard group archaeon]
MKTHLTQYKLQLDKKNIIITASLFFLLALYILSLGVEVIIKSILKANFLLVTIGILLYYFSLVVRTYRWTLFLKALNIIERNSLSLWNIYTLITYSFSLNNVFPLRMGELYRPYEYSKRTNYPLLSSFATVVLERTFDVCVMLGLIFFFLSFLGFETFLEITDLLRMLIMSIGIVIGFLCFLVLLSRPKTGKLIIRILNRIANILQKRVITNEEETATELANHLTLLFQNQKALGVGLGCTIIIWVIEGIIFWIISLSMSLDMTIMMATFILLSAGLIGNSITSASGLGQLPFMVAQLLFFLSISEELALSVSIIYLLAVFWLIIPIGSLLHLITKFTSNRSIEEAELNLD